MGLLVVAKPELQSHWRNMQTVIDNARLYTVSYEEFENTLKVPTKHISH